MHACIYAYIVLYRPTYIRAYSRLVAYTATFGKNVKILFLLFTVHYRPIHAGLFVCGQMAICNCLEDNGIRPNIGLSACMLKN